MPALSQRCHFFKKRSTQTHTQTLKRASQACAESTSVCKSIQK